MWIKQDISQINTFWYKKILKDFGFEGIGLLNHIKLLIANDPENKIPSDPEYFSLMVGFDDEEKFSKFLDLCVKQKIFLLENNFIQDINISNSLKEFEEKSRKAKENIAKRWKKENSNASTESFDKSKIEGYEGTFETSSDIKNEEIINKSYEEYYNIFTEVCTNFFGIIPELFRMPNKYEREALTQILSMINDGFFSNVPDFSDFIENFAKKISKSSKASFYMTELNNLIVKEMQNIKESEGVSTPKWILEGLEKYKLIGGYK